MTPLERAHEIVDGQGEDVSRYQRMFLAQDIAAAILAAVEAEREACAQLMDEMWANAEAGEAIRARGETQ
jgi:hypothetical protein